MTRLPGRFNDRACALLDIPDLPIHAFQHIGDHKIKPQGGGGGGIVPILVAVVAVVATVYAGPAVGSAILKGMSVTGASAATTAAVGAAAISGATSAVNTAVAGGNIGDVLKAGAIGVAAGGAGGAAGSQLGAGASAAARGAVSGATSGAVGSALRGQDVGRGALIGGVSGGVGAGVQEGLLDPNIGDVEAQEGGFYGQEGVAGTSTGLSPELARFVGSAAGRTAAQFTAQNLAPSQTGTQAPPPTGQVSTPPPMGDATTTGQPAPGSSALAQALRAGSPVIGGGGEQTTGRPVWNIASLRVKDETGS
jgi:hypothetical protein